MRDEQYAPNVLFDHSGKNAEPISPTEVAEELANWIYDLEREIVERADERGKLKHKLAALLTLDSPVAFMTPENEVLCVAKTMMADGSVSVDVVFVPWG